MSPLATKRREEEKKLLKKKLSPLKMSTDVHWTEIWGCLYQRTKCKYYMAIVAYWFKLHANEISSDVDEKSRLLSLYSLCFRYYEECEYGDRFNLLKSWGLGLPNKKYQLQFLVFYKFRRPASDSLLMMLNTVKREVGGVIDKTIRFAMEICLMYYINEKSPCQDTQDLLCISCLLQGAWIDYGGEVSDQSVWTTAALVVKRFPDICRKYFDLKNDKWILNDLQFKVIQEYTWKLGRFNRKKELEKWPILQMIPKPPYLLNTIDIPRKDPQEFKPWPYMKACRSCKLGLLITEQNCSIYHSIETVLVIQGTPVPHYKQLYTGNETPLKCKRDCKFIYQKYLDTMKRCGCLN